MAGWLLNGVLAYWIGRHAARPLLYRFVGRERFERLERMVEARRRHPAARDAARPGRSRSASSRSPPAPRARTVHVPVDDRGRLPAAHRGLRLPRQQARDPLAHRPDPLARRRGPGRAAGAHPVLPPALDRDAARGRVSPRSEPDRSRPRSRAVDGRSISCTWPAGPRDDDRRLGRELELRGERRVVADPVLARRVVEVVGPLVGVELAGPPRRPRAGTPRRPRRARATSRLRKKVSRYCHWRAWTPGGLGRDRRQGGVVGGEREVAELDPRIAGAGVLLDQRVDRVDLVVGAGAALEVVEDRDRGLGVVGPEVRRRPAGSRRRSAARR